MQQLFLSGTVGRDAELRRTQGGDPVLNFSLAVDNGKDRNGEKRAATWFDCAIWGKRAEGLARHIVKGSKLSLRGRPTARAYEGKVYLGINVDDLTFMGGGDRQQPDHYGDQQPQDTRPARDLDDEIPF